MSESGDLLQRCVALLEDALDKPPSELSGEVDEVEQKLAHARDLLIADVHRQTSPVDRSALDRVNAVLSLVVGVEYPSAGIQRNLLEQARNALVDLRTSGVQVADDGVDPVHR